MQETLDETQIERDQFPPLIKRFQSLIIDQVFIVVCMVIFSQVFSFMDDENTGAIKGVLLFSLFFIYEPFCMAYGCSVGNYIAGIRVRRVNDESKRISLGNSYIRFIVKILLGIVSFFTVTGNDKKRAIHDMASGSIMINYKKAAQV